MKIKAASYIKCLVGLTVHLFTAALQYQRRWPLTQ